MPEHQDFSDGKSKGYSLIIRFIRTKILAEKIAPELRIYAFKVCSDPHLAEDLAQEVLVKVLESKSVPQNLAELKPYVFTMLKNLYIDYIRKQNVRAEYISIQQQVFQKYNISQHDVLDNYSINKAFSRLNEEQKEIVFMVDVQGYKYREVEQITGIALGTVMSRLSRARACMLNYMQNENVSK